MTKPNRKTSLLSLAQSYIRNGWKITQPRAKHCSRQEAKSPFSCIVVMAEIAAAVEIVLLN